MVLDIEGTVTPLSFVKDKLFPYAAQHMEAFLEANHGRPEVHASLQSLHAAVRSVRPVHCAWHWCWWSCSGSGMWLRAWASPVPVLAARA